MPKDNLIEVPEARTKLRDLRLMLGISRGGFARKSGFSMKYISEVEKGKCMPTVELLKVLCNAFHANPEWLIQGKTDVPYFVGEDVEKPTEQYILPVEEPREKAEKEKQSLTKSKILRRNRRADLPRREEMDRTAEEAEELGEDGASHKRGFDKFYEQRLRLKQLRKKLNISDLDVAEKTDFSDSYVHNVEGGTTRPSIKFLKNVCKAFAVNPEWLVDGEEDVPVFLDSKEELEPEEAVEVEPAATEAAEEVEETEEMPAEEEEPEVKVEEPVAKETKGQETDDPVSRLREIRDKLNITTAAVAQKTGYSKGYVCNIESAVSHPSKKFLREICNAFSVNPKWLIDGQKGVPFFLKPESEIIQETQQLTHKKDFKKVSGVGPRLNEVKRKLNITLADFSQKSGYSIGYLCGVGRGLLLPTVEMLKNICDVFSVNPNWLIDGDLTAPMFKDSASNTQTSEREKLEAGAGNNKELGALSGRAKKKSQKIPEARERLKELRKKLKITLTRLAQRCGYSIGYFCNIESGVYEPTYNMLKKVCDVFLVNPKWLIEGDTTVRMFNIPPLEKKGDSVSQTPQTASEKSSSAPVVEKAVVQKTVVASSPAQTEVEVDTYRAKKRSVLNQPRTGKKVKFLLPGGVPLEMIYIEGGNFKMGSPERELGRYSDENLHSVIFSHPYFIGKYPVTQAQWKAVMGKNPSSDKGDNKPVTDVNWMDAMAFCAKVNSRITQSDVIQKLGVEEGIDFVAQRVDLKSSKFNLPTEAQWEYACRAGTTTALNRGKNLSDMDPCPKLDEVGWYGSNSNGMVHIVGEKAPNTWGLYDMHGNVWEWCQDWYDEEYYNKCPSNDPRGPSMGRGHVLRGGSWGCGASACRSASRNYDEPRSSHAGIGFRLAFNRR